MPQRWSRKDILKIFANMPTMSAFSCSLTWRYAMRGWSSSGSTSCCRSSPDCASVGVLHAGFKALHETAGLVVLVPHEKVHDLGPAWNPIRSARSTAAGQKVERRLHTCSRLGSERKHNRSVLLASWKDQQQLRQCAPSTRRSKCEHASASSRDPGTTCSSFGGVLLLLRRPACRCDMGRWR